MDQKPKLLIVDDEPRNQRIAIEIVEDFVEYQVAGTGEEALQIAAAYLPDLMLLDIMMPGIDGYEVCKRIRANPVLAATKIILVSGKAMLEEKLQGYLAGCDDYLTKPFMPEELLAKIKVFLKLTSVENQLRETVKVRTGQLTQAETRLINSAKMSALGEMAGGVAHEINTPLGVLTLNADLIDDALDADVLDPEKIKKFNDVNRKTVERISKIVRGLRSFSRDGSLDASTLVPVAEVVESTVTLCRERMKNIGVDLQITGATAGLNLECRPVEMSQVLLNLLNNAFDAIAPLPEKWIHLDVTDQGSEIVISVSNSGPKISDAIRDQIFNPFFTTKDVGKGTGLGLSISLGIVKSHHGTLTLDKESPVTKFLIRLPKAKETKAS